MLRRVSLANKCLLLFGAAIVFIIFATLAVPLLRISTVVDEGQRETSRRMIQVYESLRVASEVPAVSGTPNPQSPPTPPTPRETPASLSIAGGVIETLDAQQVAVARKDRPFIGEAWDTLATDAKLPEFAWARTVGLAREYWQAQPRRTGPHMDSMIVLQRQSPEATRELLINLLFLVSAGAVALGLAVMTFYLITSKLILGPVRDLRDTAEEVRRGNLATRSDIRTGDEFEELAEAFNGMLSGLQHNEGKLQAINAALDNRVIDLQSQNSSLEEANKLKGEFLANVSHELRTPLNSILGFADLLIEAAEKEAAAGDDSSRLSKRRRYVENIQSSGKTLLELINGLLEMAKVEAGKIEIAIDTVDLREFSEALLALMRPVADKRAVEVKLELAPDIPIIETDARKLQQIVFNLLANAIKFTGEAAEKRAEAVLAATRDGTVPATILSTPAVVTLRIEPLLARSGGGETADSKVRISVLDTGPGIATEHREIIFQKFTQISRGLSRKHAGTGLGLAICKELTALLQGEIHVESELGRGSMFSVILPERIDPARIAESKLEAKFRISLAARGQPVSAVPPAPPAPPALAVPPLQTEPPLQPAQPPQPARSV